MNGFTWCVLLVVVTFYGSVSSNVVVNDVKKTGLKSVGTTAEKTVVTGSVKKVATAEAVVEKVVAGGAKKVATAGAVAEKVVAGGVEKLVTGGSVAGKAVAEGVENFFTGGFDAGNFKKLIEAGSFASRNGAQLLQKLLSAAIVNSKRLPPKSILEQLIDFFPTKQIIGYSLPNLGKALTIIVDVFQNILSRLFALINNVVDQSPSLLECFAGSTVLAESAYFFKFFVDTVVSTIVTIFQLLLPSAIQYIKL